MNYFLRKSISVIFALIFLCGSAAVFAQTQSDEQIQELELPIITEIDDRDDAEISDYEDRDDDYADDYEGYEQDAGLLTEDEEELAEYIPEVKVQQRRLYTRQPDETKKELPQWLRDLRRGEIIAFGSLPFTVFFTKYTMNFINSGMSSREPRMMYSIAGSGAVVIAIVDHFIVKHKRNKASAALRVSGTQPEILLDDGHYRISSIESEDEDKDDAKGELPKDDLFEKDAIKHIIDID